MKFTDIYRGIKEDIEQVKKARKTGKLKKECEYAKKHGTYKQRVLACGLSRLLNNKKKRKVKKHKKTKKHHRRD